MVHHSGGDEPPVMHHFGGMHSGGQGTRVHPPEVMHHGGRANEPRAIPQNRAISGCRVRGRCGFSHDCETVRCGCRVNSAHIRQPRPDSGRGFQTRVRITFLSVPSALESGKLLRRVMTIRYVCHACLAPYGLWFGEGGAHLAEGLEGCVVSANRRAFVVMRAV